MPVQATHTHPHPHTYRTNAHTPHSATQSTEHGAAQGHSELSVCATTNSRAIESVIAFPEKDVITELITK